MEKKSVTKTFTVKMRNKSIGTGIRFFLTLVIDEDSHIWRPVLIETNNKEEFVC